MNIQNKIVPFKPVFFIVLLAAALVSCSESSSYLGNYLVDVHTRTVRVDTFSVKLSVLAKDSIATSGSGYMYVGSYDDPMLGASLAKSYVEFTRPTAPTDEYPRFDSVTLVLLPTGSYYGDSLVRPSLRISQLATMIELGDEGVLYSNASVPVKQVITEEQFKKKPSDTARVEIRLEDSFGTWLFDGMRKNEDAFNSDNFLKTFPGLAIEQGATGNCIYGYSVSDTSCYIRIYYHMTGYGKRTEKVFDFKPNSTKQFNHYETRYRADSNFPLNRKDVAVPTTAITGPTHNMGVVFTGPIPLYTRLDFPTIDRLPRYGEIIVVQQARLIVHPARHSYDEVPVPPTLYLYTHNTINDTRGSYLTTPTSSTSTAAPLTGNLSGRNPYVYDEYYYDYDITSYIANQMGATGYDKVSLSIDVPDDGNRNQSTMFKRLLFGDQKYSYKSEAESKDSQIMLEIIYSIYNEY